MITVTATNLPRRNSGNHLSAPKCPASGPWISKRMVISGGRKLQTRDGGSMEVGTIRKLIPGNITCFLAGSADFELQPSRPYSLWQGGTPNTEDKTVRFRLDN